MVVLVSLAFSVTVISPPGAGASLLAPKSKCHGQNLRAGSGKARTSMLCMTNFARKKSGLRAYRHVGLLDRSATRKTADIFRCGFSHEACGRKFTYWQEKLGYIGGGCWEAGENIAWGSGSLGSVRSIFNAWMHSPAHRAAILSRNYTEIGIGQKRGEFDGYSGSSVWVQQFGHRGC